MIVASLRNRVDLVVDLLLEPIWIGALEVEIIHRLPEFSGVRVPQFRDDVVDRHKARISVSLQVLELFFHLVLLVVNCPDFLDIAFVQVVLFLNFLLQFRTLFFLGLEETLELGQSFFAIVVLLAKQWHFHYFVEIGLKFVSLGFDLAEFGSLVHQ